MSRAALLGATCLSSLAVLASSPALGQTLNLNSGETQTETGPVFYDVIRVGQFTGPAGFVITNTGDVSSATAVIGVIGAGNSAEVRGTWNNSGTTTVGSSGGSNRLEVIGGGDLSTQGVYIGQNTVSTSNEVIVSGPGSTLTALNFVDVGTGSTGNSLTVQNGGVVTAFTTNIGLTETADNNTATVTGAGSALNTTFTILVGNLGSGNELEVLAGGDVTAARIALGQQNAVLSPPSDSNSITVDGTGSTLAASLELDVGVASSLNSVTVSGGGLLDSLAATIGEQQGAAENRVVVTGEGSRWDNDAGQITVGDAGSENAISILNGGDVTAAFLTIGAQATAASNSVTVDGGGSTLSSTNTLRVGEAGETNQLIVSAGGGVSANQSILGFAASSDGNSASVTGTGSSWTTTETLTIGMEGSSNELTVANGGAVTAGNVRLGDLAGANQNEVTVTGEGSVLEVTGIDPNAIDGSLFVGHSGSSNTLTVANGGKVDVAYDMILGEQTASTGNSATFTGVATGTNTVLEIGWNLYVGHRGANSSLSISDGALVTAGSEITIGKDSIDNAMTVDGAAGGRVSRIETEILTLGERGGANTLTLSDGAEAESNFGIIGRFGGANGNILTVSGGAQWDILASASPDTGRLMVGREGNLNILQLSEGGRVDVAGRITIGGDLDLTSYTAGTASGNRVTITGSDTDGLETRLSSGGLTVGVQGSDNRVEVMAGGILDMQGNALIGNSLNRGNAVMVNGEGSLWRLAGDLGISEIRQPPPAAPMGGDPNSLSIGDGGRVEVGNDLVVFGDSVIDLGAGASLTSGTLSLSDGSLLSVFIDDQRNSSIDVAGLASLDGDLDVKLGTADLQDNRYTLLTAGSIAGTFDAFDLVPSNGIMAMSELQALLEYTATEVVLVLNSEIGADQALSRNQTNVSDAINDYFNAGGVLPESFVPIFGLSGDALAATLDQLSGEVGASGGAQSAMRVNTLLLGQMTDAGLASAGPAIVPTADAPAPAPAGWSVWGSVMAATSDLPGDGGVGNPGSHDTQSDVTGIATGWDMDIAPGSRLGFAIGAGTTHWDLDDGLGSGESTYLALGAYGAQRFGDSYVSLAGSYAWHAMSTERSASLAGTQDLEADFNASSLSGRVELGHRFAAAPALGLTPYGALQGQAVYMPDYDEESSSGDGSYALSYDSGTATALRGELGARFDAELGASARLFGRLAWAHDWMSDPEIDASFQSLPGAAFTVTGAEAPENIALASLGLEASLSDRASLAGGVEGELGEDYTSLAGTIALRFSW